MFLIKVESRIIVGYVVRRPNEVGASAAFLAAGCSSLGWQAGWQDLY